MASIWSDRPRGIRGLRVCLLRLLLQPRVVVLMFAVFTVNLFLLLRMVRLPLEALQMSSNETGSSKSGAAHRADSGCQTNGHLRHALTRMKSTGCRQEAVRVSCDLQRGRLYPTMLQSTCPFRKYTPNMRLGCYADGLNGSPLKSAAREFNSTDTVDPCVSFCFLIGFELAGLKRDGRCTCGKKAHLKAAKAVAAAECMVGRCSSKDDRKCGSDHHLWIFDTGFRMKYSSSRTNLPARDQVKIAFLLQLNGRNSDQVWRLINMIYRPEHLYYVHVDVSEEYMYREMLKAEDWFGHSGNFKVKRRRFRTIWGGASLLDMMLDSAAELLEMDADWKYLINLSETDLPLLPIEELRAFLTHYNGTNFLRNHGQGSAETFISKQGLSQLFLQCEDRMWRLGERELPRGVFISGGSDWFALHRQFLTFALNVNDSLVSGLRKLFRYTLLPAESFFHVLSMNSGFCTTVASTNLKLTNWKRSRGCKCQYRDIVDWCGCSPNVFVAHDFRKISPSVARDRLLFFGRKFDSLVDTAVIDRVEQVVLNASEQRGARCQWINLFHADDQKPARTAVTIFMNYAAQQAIKTQLTSLQDSVRDCRVDRLLALNAYRVSTKLKESLRWTIEAYVETSQISDIAKVETQRRRLQSVEVGSLFDVKEEIFRNPLPLYSVGDRLYVKHTWSRPASGDAPFHIEVSWRDLNRTVVDRTVQKIVPQDDVYYVSMEPCPKHGDGEWTVQIATSGTLMATVRFPVLCRADGDRGVDEWRRRLLLPFATVTATCFAGGDVRPFEETTSSRPVEPCETTRWSSLSAERRRVVPTA